MSTAPANEFKFELHRYETLPEGFVVTGYVVHWNRNGAIFAIVGPFKLPEDAHQYMAMLKFLDPQADLHLWQMLGIKQETANGK